MDESLEVRLRTTEVGWNPHLADGRARVIRLTARGQALEQTINAEAKAAERRIAEILGPRRFAQLHSSLELLTDLS
jgi:DNA-binding MarR family transcriptional regulator